MSRPNPVLFLKRGLLFFWAAWLTIVFASNLCDFAKTLGLLGQSWTFASGNFDYIRSTTARYGTPDWLNRFLFGGVIVWEALAAVLFWRAASVYRDRKSGRRAVYVACATALFLWSGFLIADEICIAYAVEASHIRLFIAQLATLLTIELLPDE